MSGILRLESLTKGNTLKQGDKTPLKYRLFDADGEKLNIAGKTAKVRLVYPDFLTIGYEKDGLTVAQDDTVTFTIDGVIPSRIYHVEIIVDGQFIFPSRADEAKFTVDKSSLGTETNIIEIVGVDQIVNKVLGKVDADISQAVTDITTTNEAIQQAETQRVLAESERNEKFEEYSETFSNVSNVIEGAEGSMENLISNGDFSKDSNGDGLADGVRVSSGVTHSLVNGTQSFTPTKTYDALVNFNFAGDGVSRYYISALVKSNKNTTQMRIASPTAIIKPHSGSGQFERLSVIGVASSTRIIQLGTDSFSKVDVRNWVAINLDVFDSEPTIDEMDRLMDLHGGYFEGKVSHKLSQRVLVNSLIDQPKLVDSRIQDLTDTIVSQGGNLYDKPKHFIPDVYSDTKGVVAPASGWGLAKIPVEPESEYSIMLPNFNNYRGDIGSVSFYKGTELVSFAYPASNNINGQYNGANYITLTAPAGSDNINITVKGPTFDESNSLIVVEGSLIDDKTMHKRLVSFYGASVENIKDLFMIEGGNLYDKNEHYRPNYYASTDGKLLPANNWGLSIVPVESLKEYSVWLDTGNYTGSIGSLIFLDADENTIDFLYPASNYKNGAYKGVSFITVSTPENTAYIGVTSKIANTSDSSDTLIVLEGDSISSGKLEKRLIGYDNILFPTITSDKEYAGVKWTVVGDSLTEFNSRSSKFYHEYIADELGFEVTNMGVGGTGYARTSENNTAFYQRINNIPLDTEVVTIFGSFNDLGSPLPLGTSRDTGTETIAGCMNTTLDNLNARLPTVPVGIIAPTPWHTTRPWLEENGGSKYTALLTQICRDRGLPLLDLYHTSGLRPWEESYRTLVYSKDPVGNGTHPNEIGHELISKRIREFVKTLI